MPEILVLSLSSATERRKETQAELDGYGLPFRFFDAPVASELAEDDFSEFYDNEANCAHYKTPLSKGELACYLGHIGMWREIAASGSRTTLILEDDCHFLRDPRPVLEEAENFELSNVIVKLDGEAPSDAIEVMRFGDGSLLRTNVLPPRTTGYLIGAHAAKAMLAARSRFFRPVDMDLKHYWEHGVPILTMRPALISERPETISMITRDRRDQKSRSPLRRLMSNFAYQRAFRQGIRSENNAEGVLPAARPRNPEVEK